MLGLVCSLLISTALSSVESKAMNPVPANRIARDVEDVGDHFRRGRNRRAMDIQVGSEKEAQIFIDNTMEAEKQINEAVTHAESMKQKAVSEDIRKMARALHLTQEYPEKHDKYSEFLKHTKAALAKLNGIEGEGESLCKVLKKIADGFSVIMEYVKRYYADLAPSVTDTKTAVEAATVNGGACDHKKTIQLLTKVVAELDKGRETDKHHEMIY